MSCVPAVRELCDPPTSTILARHSGCASVMPYDPAKVKPAPPRYQPAAEAGDEEAGPVYDESAPPSWKDFIKAAVRARKILKNLKP